MAAVRARQHQQVQQPIITPSTQPTIIRRKKPTKQKFEKTMLLVLLSTIVVLSVFVLNKQAAIQMTNIDIQKIEAETEELKKQNIGLTVRVNELSTYDNIWKKAQKLGLTKNEKNVKVVPGE
ncbi:cell division protein FtsL [Lysinibacillus piscis]|uniref:Cell division protein FtsL n=1 Tax=Lysinibacillus piscis TaxID=2518931 RepID=A0ABQ5NHH1_9BACI|nr:cell division protein FtsL [Lysinibacillus sp. KH24]GLC87558.1 hypothetical protein LYSBPC_06850 [Lysinibacillus sp. KH24]